ncbi:MAG: uracil-DNA glycosylase family protein, partial [Candidatus Bathyarchaeia archaeon]
EIAECTRCPLHRTRRMSVPGDGNFRAELMFIGEGPGREEDIQGRPFVGRAGKLLDELLSEIDVDRRHVFITNIVKCRPSEDGKDRRPTEEEIKSCTIYLDRQIELINPRIICTLGDTATRYIFMKNNLKVAPLSAIHGRAFHAETRIIFPCYHPAAALYNPQLRGIFSEDFKRLRDILNAPPRKIGRTLDEFLC